MFDLNGTLVIFVASFLCFMWLLNQVYLKPVGKAIEMRAEKINADLQAGKAARHEAEKLLESYEQDLKRIRAEAQAVINNGIDAANKQRAAEIDAVAKKGHAKLAEAKAALENERETVIAELVPQVRELVETITRKVLGDESVHVNVDAGQVRRTLEEIS